MSKTPSTGGSGRASKVVEDIDLASDPATALPTASADPTLVRRPESTRTTVRVALRRLSSVVIKVHAPGAGGRPATFAVVGMVAVVTASLTALTRPAMAGGFAAVSLWLLVVGTGGAVFMVGLRFVDKRISDRDDDVN